MSDSLKNLLKAEADAEAIVSEGERERDAIVQNSIDDAAEMLRQFEARLPEMHQSFIDKAEQRAEQTIAELKLRYDQRNIELRELASKHRKETVEQAVVLVLEATAADL